MRPGEWVACILEYIFIKFFVLFLFDLIFISNPKRLVLVNSLELTVSTFLVVVLLTEFSIYS